MDKEIIDGFIKEAFPGTDNPKSFRLATKIYNAALKWHKHELTLKRTEWKAEQKAKAVSAGNGEINAKIQEFLENPMPPEDEARYLRAYLHAGLAAGDVNPQVLEKIDKIIGINSGEDEKTETVDFSTAFPDLKTAIDICSKPKPETK